MERTTITLKHPFSFEGLNLQELKMRRPKVVDLMIAEKQKTDVEKEITLLSNLCEVSPKCIQELDLADYAQVQKAYQGFFD